jgi:hypothetical protein
MEAELSAALEALQDEVDRVGDGALTEALRRVLARLDDGE